MIKLQLPYKILCITLKFVCYTIAQHVIINIQSPPRSAKTKCNTEPP